MQIKLILFLLFFCQIDTETCKCLTIFRACMTVEKTYTVSTTIRTNYLDEILVILIKIKDVYTRCHKLH